MEGTVAPPGINSWHPIRCKDNSCSLQPEPQAQFKTIFKKEQTQATLVMKKS